MTKDFIKVNIRSKFFLFSVDFLLFFIFPRVSYSGLWFGFNISSQMDKWDARNYKNVKF